MKGPSGFYSSLGLLVLLNAVIKPLWIFAIFALGLFFYGLQDVFSLLLLPQLFVADRHACRLRDVAGEAGVSSIADRWSSPNRDDALS